MSELFDIHLEMPWGQTIEFPKHRPLAHGMRLSTHCPVQRVAEYLDEDCGTPFDPGVGAIGHLYQFLWSHQTRQEEEVRELAVPWKHGVAHIDRVIGVGSDPGVYEVKTTSDKVLKPKRETICQMMRQQFAVIQPENTDALEWVEGLRWYNVIIGKAGMESGWVRGPWEVSLDDEAPIDTEGDPITGHEYAAWDLEATDTMLERAHEFLQHEDMPAMLARPDLVGDLCVCGAHRLPPPVRLDDPKLAEAVSGYRSSLDREKSSKDAKAEEFEKIKGMLAGMEPGRYEVAGFSVTKGETGKVTVR